MSARVKLVKIYFGCSFLICLVVSILGGRYLPFSIQKTLASVLAGVSSILFGVLGIWIGIMAPDNLRAIYTSDDTVKRTSNWKELESLYKPVFISLILFILTTAFSFVGELLSAFSWFHNYKMVIRSLGSFVILFALFFTIYLVFLAIKPGIEMLAKSFIFIRRANTMDELFPDKKNK